MVKDRTVLHGLLAGYRGRLMKGQYPLAAIFLTVPPDQVDVNVHPTKHEVRFGRARQVHTTLVQTISAALAAAEQPLWRGTRLPEKAADAPSQVKERAVSYDRRENLPTPPGPGQAGIDPTNRKIPAESPLTRPTGDDHGSVPSPSQENLAADHQSQEPAPQPQQQQLWAEGDLAALKVIGQFAHTYIVCEAGGDLVLVDQHAAHERIYFERLQDQSAAGKASSQQLLLPETVELSFREGEILSGLLKDLKAHGLDVGPFGGNTFAIRAVPAFLSTGGAETLLREIVEKAAESDSAPELAGALERGLYVMACHGAIRANQRLDPQQMQRLLQQLAACRNPAHCPHGRPTWIQIPRRELDKRFRRII
jgi:DNA mismatch repair protein MutL